MWAQSGVVDVLFLTHSLTDSHTHTCRGGRDGPCYTRSRFDTQDSPPWSTSRLQKVSEMNVAARTDSICDLWTLVGPLNCRLFAPLLQDASPDASWRSLSLLGSERAEKDKSEIFSFLEGTSWALGFGTLSLFRSFPETLRSFFLRCLQTAAIDIPATAGGVAATAASTIQSLFNTQLKFRSFHT